MSIPERRVIVLGASNAVRGLSVIIETACRAWGRPLDILAAIGHGRSYGLTTSVLGRTLPSILECDLWDELRTRTPRPTATLITDIGNDILYGASPQQIVSWVRRCFERLANVSDRIVVTELPLASVQRVGPRRFLMVRSVLFPRSQITFQDAIFSAQELNRQVLALAGEFGASVVKPDASWFGLDAIHIRGRHLAPAWREILGPWQIGEAFSAAPHI